MTPGSPYRHPPIVEAILDIQVELPVSFTLDSLLKCQKNVKAEYPDRRNAQEVVGEISVGHRIATSASAEPVGFIFSSTDNKQLFQAKRTGFTFNRLAPYPGWDLFVGEGRRLWDEYRRVTRPLGYRRVALRYIDRFNFPFPMVKLETYFRTYPEVSRDLPQLLQGFFFRFNLPLGDISAVATITQTMVEPAQQGHSSVILDIDLYKTDGLPSGNELPALFETLRVWKNKVFEACITDDARELIR